MEKNRIEQLFEDVYHLVCQAHHNDGERGTPEYEPLIFSQIYEMLRESDDQPYTTLSERDLMRALLQMVDDGLIDCTIEFGWEATEQTWHVNEEYCDAVARIMAELKK